MAVVSTMLYTLKVLTMFYALDVQVFILLNRSNTMQGRKTCARRHKKNAPRTEKHVQEDKKKIRRRDLVGGLFSFSPHQLSLSCSLLRTGPIFNPLYQCKLLACSTAELQHFSSTCSLILFRLVRAKTAKRWPKRLKYRLSFHRHFMGNLLSYEMNKLYRGLTPLKMKGDHFSKSSLSSKDY